MESWTLEAAIAVVQCCFKVKLIHLCSNLVTNVFIIPVTAELQFKLSQVQLELCAVKTTRERDSTSGDANTSQLQEVETVSQTEK